MAKNINLTLSPAQSKLGKIKIAPRVLKIIASIAAGQIKGVNRTRNSFTNGVHQLLGHRYSGSGIKLAFDDQHRLVVDVYVDLNYGISVPQVAEEIQDKVKQQLLFMTDLKVGSVNVHVNGIIPAKSKSRQRVDPNNLFNDEDDHK